MEQKPLDVSDMFIVSPVGQSITLTPGERYSGDIVVTNPASANNDFGYRVTVAPYFVVGDDYSADLATETAWSAMVDWLTIENPTGVLQPNESVHVQFHIDVPADAVVGGQYAALMVGSSNSDETSGAVRVNNVYEMASILYAKVAGTVTRSGSILENSFPSFATDVPFSTSVRVENAGNIHETAHVTVLVKNSLTGEEIYAERDESNTIDDIIMPGTTKEIVRDIQGLPIVGVYEVTQDVDYMGQYSTESHQVIVCPIWLIAIAALIVAAIIAGFIALIRHLHKKRSRYFV